MNSWLGKTIYFVFAYLLVQSQVALAVTASNSFNIPQVLATQSGAVLFQTQSGSGMGSLYSTDKLKVLNSDQSDSENPEFPISYYLPKNDPFAEGSYDIEFPFTKQDSSNSYYIDFDVRNNIVGSFDYYMGTTNTIFTFIPDIREVNKNFLPMLYRWDFENDGKYDTYFSAIGLYQMQFSKAGIYNVKLETLSSQGVIGQVTKQITVVNNSPPKGFFKVIQTSIPKNTLIRFDTSLSSDDQYNHNQLKYRFDFNGDGLFDTEFKSNKNWYHIYRDSGSYEVVMEVMDPEGLSSRSMLQINILDDNPPTALFNVEKVGDFKYKFDASNSDDDFTPQNRLQYRWDFDYQGKDDIIFSTNWTSLPKYSGSYRLGGSHTIRLQVKDGQGLIDETFAEIYLPWPEDIMNSAISIISEPY